MIKKILIVVLILCVLFMFGSIVFACNEESPSPSKTIEPSETIEPSPEENTIQPSINPTSISNLPKTGENKNILIYIGISIIIINICITIIFRKKLFNN